MKVFYLRQVARSLEKLNKQDRARLDRTREFFEEYGFQIGQKYLKKIRPPTIWELRAGRIRLFLCIKRGNAFGVHLIYKKTQRLLKADIELAVQRCKKL